MAGKDKGQMLIELNQLEECAASLKRINESMLNIRKELGRALTYDGQTVWDGDAKLEYVSSIGDTFMLLYQTNMSVERDQKQLVEAIAVYRQKEGLANQAVQTLSTSDIF